MIRLFTSGTHNHLTFSDADIEGIYNKSKGGDKIPFVLGHPKNDLPILGWLGRDKLALYKEGDKMSIGFNKSDAEFSEESMNALRTLNQNKISIRLLDGLISHAGLVSNAAVKENNHQDFEDMQTYDDKMNACFSVNSELPLTIETEKQSMIQDFKNLLNDFKNNLFIYKNTKNMNENKQDFASTIAEQSKQIEHLQTQLIEAQKQTADFQLKVKNEKLDIGMKNLEAKIKALSYDEVKAKATTDFGTALLEKDESLFNQWLAGLFSDKAAVKIVNGSVARKDFAADGKESLGDALKKQFETINK